MKKTLLIMLAMVIGMTAIAYTVQAKQAKNETKATASERQKTVIKGKITDANGEPVIGATIMVNGTSNGVISDIDGNYEIEVSLGDVITVSFLGYKSKSFKVTAINQDGSVVLEEDAISL